MRNADHMTFHFVATGIHNVHHNGSCQIHRDSVSVFLLLHFEMILKFLSSGDHWPNCATLQAWKEELSKSAPKLQRVLRSTVWLPHHLVTKRCVSSCRLLSNHLSAPLPRSLGSN